MYHLGEQYLPKNIANKVELRCFQFFGYNKSNLIRISLIKIEMQMKNGQEDITKTKKKDRNAR